MGIPASACRPATASSSSTPSSRAIRRSRNRDARHDHGNGGRCKVRARRGHIPPCAQTAWVCRHDAPLVRALVVHGDDVPVGAAAVLRAADVRQDGAAGARRLTLGVGRRHLLLPGGAAGRLLLCALPDRPCVHAADGPDPSGRLPAGVHRAAHRSAVRLE